MSCFWDDDGLERAFQLMAQYADAPMDLADASLVALAERLELQTVFTIDRGRFHTYRIQRGHRYLPFELCWLIATGLVRSRAVVRGRLGGRKRER